MLDIFLVWKKELTRNATDKAIAPDCFVITGAAVNGHPNAFYDIP